MLKEIVLLSLVLSLVTGQCQANYQIEGLEKSTISFTLDSITFNNDGQIVSSTQTYNHLFYSFFTTTPAIAIGTSIIKLSRSRFLIQISRTSLLLNLSQLCI